MCGTWSLDNVGLCFKKRYISFKKLTQIYDHGNLFLELLPGKRCTFQSSLPNNLFSPILNAVIDSVIDPVFFLTLSLSKFLFTSRLSSIGQGFLNIYLQSRLLHIAECLFVYLTSLFACLKPRSSETEPLYFCSRLVIFHGSASQWIALLWTLLHDCYKLG